MAGHKCPSCGTWIRCPSCNEIITANNLSIVSDYSTGKNIEYCSKACYDKKFYPNQPAPDDWMR